MSTSRPIPKDSPIIRLLEKHGAEHGVFVSHLDHSAISAKVYAKLFSYEASCTDINPS
jgi:hypothetical protein